jgi:hypothetical protein
MLFDMRKSITLLLLMLGLGMGASAVKGQLMITEIMYNSPEPGGFPDLLQFIEVRNVGASVLDVQNYRVTSNLGVNYVFPTLQVPAGGFVVIARDLGVLLSTLGITVTGDDWGSGHLDTTAGTIKVINPSGTTIDSVSYLSGSPWPSASNNGHSITLCQSTIDNSFGSAWSQSNTPTSATVGGVTLNANPGNCCDFQNDSNGPLFLSGGALTDSRIGLKFNEEIAGYSLSSANFTGVANISSVVVGSTSDSILLLLGTPLADGIFQNLLFSGLADTACNLGGSGSLSVVYNDVPARFSVVEILYDDQTLNDSLQFIEFANKESFSIEIGGFRMDGGDISLNTFPQRTVTPNGRVVVARFPSVIERVFGITDVIGWDTTGGTGVLSSSSRLKTDNSVHPIDDVTYQAVFPWPQSTFMEGHSIEICDIQNINVDGNNWAWSLLPGDFAGLYSGDSIFASPGKDNCRPVSLEDWNDIEVSVFPNPFSNVVNIKLEDQRITSFDVLNLAGQSVLSQNLEQGLRTYDLSGLPEGFYMMSFSNERAEVVHVVKLIRR